MKEERRREEEREEEREKEKRGERKGVYNLLSITLVSDIICSITLSKNLLSI